MFEVRRVRDDDVLYLLMRDKRQLRGYSGGRSFMLSLCTGEPEPCSPTCRMIRFTAASSQLCSAPDRSD
jgi:hypothetical protein